MNAPKTMFDKIWDRHTIMTRPDGATLLHVARHLVHDGSRAGFKYMVDNGLSLRHPERNFGTYPDRCEPNEKDPKKAICPPYTVGDEVTITGPFKVSSPHSERNSDGLLVYKKMKNLTKNWETPDIEPPPGAGSGAPPKG